MKKLAAIIVILLAFSNITYSQNKISYQGEVSIGYGLGVGDFNANRFYVETIHGVRINSYLFTGIGVGGAFYGDELNQGLVIPIFGHIKGYLTNGNVKPYIYTSVGYGYLDAQGLYCTGGLGVDFQVSRKVGIFVNLGYQSQSIAKGHRTDNPFEPYYGASKMGALMLHFGFSY